MPCFYARTSDSSTRPDINLRNGVYKIGFFTTTIGREYVLSGDTRVIPVSLYYPYLGHSRHRTKDEGCRVYARATSNNDAFRPTEITYAADATNVTYSCYSSKHARGGREDFIIKNRFELPTRGSCWRHHMFHRFRYRIWRKTESETTRRVVSPIVPREDSAQSREKRIFFYSHESNGSGRRSRPGRVRTAVDDESGTSRRACGRWSSSALVKYSYFPRPRSVSIKTIRL